MFFFDHILNPPKTGRHTEAGVIDRLMRELTDLRKSRDTEVRGYQQALQQAGRDVEEARGRSDFHMRGWQAADREVKRLRAILNADAGVPGTVPQPAVADTEGSCFNEPDPPLPERDQEQLPPIALTLPRPDTYDVSDPTAETQAVPQIGLDETQPVDVSKLRDAVGEGDTRTLPVVSPVIPVEPVPPVTWGITATKPLWQVPAGPGSSRPEELSPTAGRLATVRVADAMNEAS